MSQEEKKVVLKAKEVEQQVVAISEIDFNSNIFLKELEKLDQEIQSIKEGAVVNPEKLTFNFTV